MVGTIAPPEPQLAPPRLRARHGRGLLLVAVLVAVVLQLPLLFLVIKAGQVGWDALSAILFRHLPRRCCGTP